MTWNPSLDAISLISDDLEYQRQMRAFRAGTFSGIKGSTVANAGEKKSLAVPRPRRGYRHNADEEWLKQVKTSAILRIPLMRTATDVAAVPWRLFRMGDPGPDGRPEKVEIHDHPLKRLWMRPNPHMTGMQFRKLITIYHKVNGCIALRIFEGPDGKPESIWPIPRRDVLHIPEVSNPPKPNDKPYWTIRWRGRDENIPPQNLIWITEIDPEDPYGSGAGDLECLRHQVKLEYFMNLWSTNGFRQGSHMGYVIGVPALNDDDIDELAQDYEANHTGVESVGRPLFVKLINGQPQIQVMEVGKGHKDLDWVEGKKSNAAQARHVMGVPPELVGDVTDSNRATAEAADYIHAKNNVKPELLFLAEAMAVYLTPLFGEPDLLLEPDECVKETADQRHKFLEDGAKGAKVTIDEWRIGHGMKPLGGATGRLLVIPVNMAFMDADGGPIITAYPVKPVTAESPVGTEETAPTGKVDAKGNGTESTGDAAEVEDMAAGNSKPKRSVDFETIDLGAIMDRKITIGKALNGVNGNGRH